MNTMPVLVEVPVNHEAVTDLPESLLERINFKKTSDEVAADSERMSARSEVLREAHLASVRDRAARETQVGVPCVACRAAASFPSQTPAANTALAPSPALPSSCAVANLCCSPRGLAH